MIPLPHRHPERGWFSIPGEMARFGVTEGIVRRWISTGVVRATRADFGTHRNVYWLEGDRRRHGGPAGRAYPSPPTVVIVICEVLAYRSVLRAK
jgi:hypothetical protein